jgi:hypothetical protein
MLMLHLPCVRFSSETHALAFADVHCASQCTEPQWSALFFAPNLVSHTKLTPTHQMTDPHLSPVCYALWRYLSRGPVTPRATNAICQSHTGVAPPGLCTYMTPARVKQHHRPTEDL